MPRVVPNLNKTHLKAALSKVPPGSYSGFIDWAGITVVPWEAKRLNEDGWMEVFIPYRLDDGAYITMNDMNSVFNSIEHVWGKVAGASGAKGLMKYKNKNCFYLCFKPRAAAAGKGS